MNQPTILTHTLDGVVVAYDVKMLLKGVLIAGPDCAPIAQQLQADGAQLVAQGALTLRLGVTLYDRPFLFIPHLIVDETGRAFEGEIVFDWLRANAYDMPRSEVFGMDARGREAQVFARDVDVESSPIVVGGSNCAPVYVAAVMGRAALPPRFEAALKRLTPSSWADVRDLVVTA